MTTCPFCGCGCGIYLQIEGQRVVGVTASAAHPVSQGRLCVKGWHAHELAASSRRLRKPLVRRGDGLAEASWDEALGLVVGRLTEIRSASGGEAIGFLGSARSTNEDNFLLAKLARCAVGTNNIDFSARLETLPDLFDLPQHRHLTVSAASLGDLDRADLILLWRSDPAEEHPAAAARIMRAAERMVPVIEVGARSGQLGGLATVRLRPRPGTEVRLAAGLLHAALSAADGLPATAEVIAASVADCTPEHTETSTGVPAGVLKQAGEAIAKAARPLVVYSRSATLAPEGAEALMGLAALGRMRNQSADSWPHLLWLSTHCNSQGARDMGVVPYFLSGYQAVGESGVRDRFSQAWGVTLPEAPGLPVWDMLAKVKALYVMADDPVQALPDPRKTREELGGLELLVVQDSFLSATAQAADVVLPGASFAEKDGTFTSTERRVQRVRRAVAPPGEARPDWEVVCDLSARLGYPMRYESPQQVMDEITSLTPLYAGVSYERLDESGGVCWSLAGALDEETAGRAGDPGEDPVPIGEDGVPETDHEHPLTLVVDYGLGGWTDDAAVAHSIALSRELGSDRKPAMPVVSMSREDALETDVREGGRVRVHSRNGEMEAAVHISDAVQPGVVVLPFMMREAASTVMPASAHAETGMPVLSPCAVRVERL